MPAQLDLFLILAFVIWMIGSGRAKAVRDAVFS